MAAKQFYYTVGDRIHPSSELALIDHSKTGDKILFHTGYEFFNQDWRVEPVQSLAELKKQRAQQIRDRYNKVALAYSGGTDSHTVLRSFVENNIKLDEIIILRTQHNPYRIWEFDNVTLPLLEKYQKRWNTTIPVTQVKSNTKLIYADTLSGWKDDKYHSFFREVLRNDFNPIIDHFSHKHNEYALAKYTSNDCVVWGHEKPHVRISNHKSFNGYWCYQIADHSWGNQDTLNEHCATEAFFISNDLPELQIKLAWKLVKFLDSALDDETKSNDYMISKLQSYISKIDESVMATYQQNGFSIDSQSKYSKGLYRECLEAMEYTPISPILAHPWTKPELTQEKINYLAKLKNEIEDKKMYNDTMDYIKKIRSQVSDNLKFDDSLMLKPIWSKPSLIMKASFNNARR